MGLLHVLQTVPSNTQPTGGTRVRNDRHIFTSEQEPGERLREPGMVAHGSNPSSWEAGAGGLA